MSLGPDTSAHLGALTGAYALDALDDTERVRLSRHLRSCTECRAEVDAFRETAARLASATATPPPARLRASVLAEVARTRQLPPDSAVRARGRRPGPVLAAAAAALVVVGGAGLGASAWSWRQDAREAQQVVADVGRVLADPQRVVLDAPFGAGGEGRGTVVVAGDEVVVLADGAPAPGQDRDYQMWFIAEGDIRPAGLMERTDDGRWWGHAAGIRSGDAVGVTVEPDGGSEQPTSDPVMAVAAG
jgi:anti-sigma-K factor RskA